MSCHNGEYWQPPPAAEADVVVPIVLLDEIPKMLEKILIACLVQHLEEAESGLSKAQFGFRVGRSNLEALNALRALREMYSAVPSTACLLRQSWRHASTIECPTISEEGVPERSSRREEKVNYIVDDDDALAAPFHRVLGPIL
ncbi:unnamed protein product [Euphydryas editha]|uniref:Reverse transcriptase n=1 Tax=Euphydryas editha TaxID=104508 RepID=A0AAU9TVN7_EUPED|nr:unnamed protein product [Euphydryas editha]